MKISKTEMKCEWKATGNTVVFMFESLNHEGIEGDPPRLHIAWDAVNILWIGSWIGIIEFYMDTDKIKFTSLMVALNRWIYPIVNFKAPLRQTSLNPKLTILTFPLKPCHERFCHYWFCYFIFYILFIS